MLHRTVLPGHARWASFLRRLRFVVIDECHTYRGVFGSHVAQVLRRLRRVCAAYGATPSFVLASATAADPARSASRLTGLPGARGRRGRSPARGNDVRAVGATADRAAGRARRAGAARSRDAEAARLLADLVVEGARTIAFVRSRRGAELTALGAQRHLAEAGRPELADRIAAYRAGYLPKSGARLEDALSSGRLLGVAATNALELGRGHRRPGRGAAGRLSRARCASLWQQAGRAGRAGAESLVVFVARDDPLDTYLVHHPRGAVRPAGRGDCPRSEQPVRARPAAVLRRGGAADRRGELAAVQRPRRTRRCSAVTACSSSRRAAPAPAAAAGTGRHRSGHEADIRGDRRQDRWPWSRTPPAR